MRQKTIKKEKKASRKWERRTPPLFQKKPKPKQKTKKTPYIDNKSLNKIK